MVAMFLVPPLVTMIVCVINTFPYRAVVLPMIYAVCFMPILVGQITSLVYWGICHQDGRMPCRLMHPAHEEQAVLIDVRLLSVVPWILRLRR